MPLAYNQHPELTYRVDLSGGVERLREAALYVCAKSEGAEFFDVTKLEKILWLADFTSFAERALPVTGRMYQRAETGPGPIEMLSLLSGMLRRGEISVDSGQRPKALTASSPQTLSASDLVYLDKAISRLLPLAADAASDPSRGIAWKSRANGDLMPYQLAYLTDDPLPL